MSDYVLKTETGDINSAPTGFRLAARDFFQCYLDFTRDRFSVVPFFLCCCAIELALKSVHLESLSKAEIKNRFSHSLKALYDALPPDKRALSASELALLAQASAIYCSKDLEYVQAADAASAFNRFPDLDALAHIAEKLVS